MIGNRKDLLGLEDEPECPPDRNPEGGGAATPGEVVDDDLRARMSKPPGQHRRLSVTEPPGLNRGRDHQHLGDQQPRVLVNRANGRVVLAAAEDLVCDFPRHDDLVASELE